LLCPFMLYTHNAHLPTRRRPSFLFGFPKGQNKNITHDCKNIQKEYTCLID
jgi:hypothetical protein